MRVSEALSLLLLPRINEVKPPILRIEFEALDLNIILDQSSETMSIKYGCFCREIKLRFFGKAIVASQDS